MPANRAINAHHSSRHTARCDDVAVALGVRLTNGRIGRKVRLGVFSRGHEIASGGRPACGTGRASHVF